MSQDSMKRQSRQEPTNLSANSGSSDEKYEGFEGMNYEQIRQPYNNKHKTRSNSTDERKDSKSPENG